MTKHISTLVDDIYSTISSGDFEINTKELAEMIGHRITEKKGPGTLRMSNVGTPCDRKLYYSVKESEKAEPLPPYVRLKFLIGDILEVVALTLAKAAGHDVQGEQDTLEVAGVKGHRDAVIDGMTVDVKSANSRSFDKFKYHQLREGNDPFGYLDQLGLYVTAGKDDPKVTNKNEGAFLAIDKELGHIHLDKHRKKDVDYEEVVHAKKFMLQSDTPPARGYSPVPDGKSGNMVIPMECKYCPFKEHCYSDINGGKGLRKVVFANGPRWFTKVEREPNLRNNF